MEERFCMECQTTLVKRRGHQKESRSSFARRKYCSKACEKVARSAGRIKCSCLGRGLQGVSKGSPGVSRGLRHPRFAELDQLIAVEDAAALPPVSTLDGC